MTRRRSYEFSPKGGHAVPPEIEEKIVSLRRDHNVSSAALRERFGYSFATIERILRDAGQPKAPCYLAAGAP